MNKAKNSFPTLHLDSEFDRTLLSTAVMQSADAILITDNTGVILYVNPAFEKICGYTSTEVIGKTPSILSSKLHKASFYKRIWKELRAGNIFKDTFVNKRKDGTLYYLEQVITPVKNEEGIVKYFVSTGRDTTKQRIAQESLETSERQKQAILDTVPDLIFLIDLDGRVLNVYGNIPEFKVSPELIKNKLISDLLPKAEAKSTHRIIRKVITTGIPSVLEYRLDKGVNHPGSYEARFVKTGENECLCMVRNITEEEVLKQNQQLFEFIANTTQDHMVMIDKDHRYVAANDAYCKAHGKNRDEIIGRLVSDIWPRDLYLQYMKNYLKDCFSGKKVKAQIWLSFSHKKPVFMDLTYYPYRLNGKDVTHAIAMAHDLTDRKLGEEKLNKLYKDQAQLFSEIAHTLKTPLTVLLGNIDSLNKPQDKEVREEIIDLMKHNIIDANRNITSMLKVAKLEMLPAQLVFNTTDLGKLLTQTHKQAQLLYRSLYPTVNSDEISNLCSLESSIRLSLITDENKLKEVLLTIIENALLHSPNNDELPRVKISAVKLKDKVQIQIRDFGKGMSKKELRNAFTLYHRGRSNKPGYGIGLPFSKKVITSLGGDIEVMSKKNEGTIVTILLPI